MASSVLKSVATPSRVALLALGAVALLVLVFSMRDTESPTTWTALDRLIVDLEERVAADPQDPGARVQIAAAYLERGLLEQSITQYREALVLMPDNQPAMIGLARALMENGDMAGAEEQLHRVVELNADNEFRYTMTVLATVHYDLAMIALERDDPEEARVQLAESVKVVDSDSDTWRLIGRVEERLGNPEAAEAAYFTAVRYVPDYAAVYRDLEALYERRGMEGARSYAQGMLRILDDDLDGAVKKLEAAVAAVPEMAAAHEGLGIAYEKAGRHDEALQAYRTALTLDPAMYLSEIAVRRLEAR